MPSTAHVGHRFPSQLFYFCDQNDKFGLDSISKWPFVSLQYTNRISHQTNNYSAALQDLRPIVISGPSGVGKGTLITRLFEEHPNTFAFSVSHTTRAPRAGEIEGKNYFFVDPSTFTNLISQGGFVEHTIFNGDHYGTSKEAISDQISKRLVVLLDIEMNGVRQMKANPSIDARYVFIKPPSLEILEARLRGRGTENEGSIQNRIAQAQVELQFIDSQSDRHDKIIVNDNIETAYQELEGFIFGLG